MDITKSAVSDNSSEPGTGLIKATSCEASRHTGNLDTLESVLALDKEDHSLSTPVILKTSSDMGWQ